MVHNLVATTKPKKSFDSSVTEVSLKVKKMARCSLLLVLHPPCPNSLSYSLAEGIPQRVRSMYVAESPKRDEVPASAGLNGKARHDKAAEAEDGGETPNGATKKEGEFVLFL